MKMLTQDEIICVSGAGYFESDMFNYTPYSTDLYIIGGSNGFGGSFQYNQFNVQNNNSFSATYDFGYSSNSGFSIAPTVSYTWRF